MKKILSDWLHRTVFAPKRKKQTEKILSQLRETPTLQNFTDHRFAEMSLYDTLYIVEKAVSDRIVTWQDLQTNSEAIERLYNEQVKKLIALYEISFTGGYWQSYAHAVNGFQEFNALSFQQSEDLLPEENCEHVRQLFAAKIYDFLRIGNNSFSRHPLRREAAIDVITKKHRFSEGDLWIIRKTGSV